MTNANFTHDANGNLTQDGALADYVYDAWNRLVYFVPNALPGGRSTSMMPWVVA